MINEIELNSDELGHEVMAQFEYMCAEPQHNVPTQANLLYIVDADGNDITNSVSDAEFERLEKKMREKVGAV